MGYPSVHGPCAGQARKKRHKIDLVQNPILYKLIQNRASDFVPNGTIRGKFSKQVCSHRRHRDTSHHKYRGGAYCTCSTCGSWSWSCRKADVMCLKECYRGFPLRKTWLLLYTSTSKVQLEKRHFSREYFGMRAKLAWISSRFCAKSPENDKSGEEAYFLCGSGKSDLKLIRYIIFVPKSGDPRILIRIFTAHCPWLATTEEDHGQP